MKKQMKLNWRKFLTLTIFLSTAVIISSFVYVSAENNNLVVKKIEGFKVGDKVEVSVSGLVGDRYYEPCVITEVRANGYMVKCVAGNGEYFVLSSWVRAMKKTQSAKKTEQVKDNETKPKTAEDEDISTNEQIFKALDRNESGWLSGKELIACDCKEFDKNGDNEVTKDEFVAGMNKKEKSETDGDDDPPAAKKAQNPVNEPKPRQTVETPPNKLEAHSGPLTETIVKQIVIRIQERVITGVPSSPNAVTVNFENIRFGTTRKATLRDEFGRIPKGETVYPVSVKHSIHRQWQNGHTEDMDLFWIYEFFKNQFGEWEAYYAGEAR